jgi:flagellar basal-body rod protein FlgB
MEKLFNKTINSLADMVDVRARKHRVILSNVANIDTPGFKPSEMSFANELESAKNVRITRTNPAHLAGSLTQTNPGHLAGKTGAQGSLRYDIKESDEPVKLDTEMATLSENQLLYSATVEILAKKFRGIRSTLTDR